MSDHHGPEGAYTRQIRTSVMATLLNTFCQGSIGSVGPAVEQQGLDVLSVTRTLTEPNHVDAEYETVITVSVVRRPK